MIDSPSPPRIFANHVLKQMVEHSFGGDMIIEPDDYLAIRTAFRSMGGLWTQIMEGDLIHLELMKQVVTAWGQMPNRKSETDQVI